MHMTSQSKAFAFAIATLLLWSSVATAFKITLRYLDIFQLLFYACVTSVVLLLSIIIIQKKVLQLFAAMRRHWKITMIAGFLNPCLYYLVLFEAYDRLPAQVAQPINITWAITLTFMSIIFLKQKITMADIAGALVCYGGVVIIATQGDLSGFASSDLIGVGLALFSTIIWAGYWILNIRDPREPTIGMTLNFMVALPITAIVCALFSDFSIPREGILGAIYTGLFEMSVAFLCWSMALRLTDNTSRISNLIFLIPFISLVFISQVLGEVIYSTTYIGLIFIIGGLVYQQWSHTTANTN